jgi:Flp pilus assembly pilin Flp
MRDTIKAALARLFTNKDGQSVVEYGLLISLFVLVIVTMLTAAHGQLGALVSTAAAVTPR